MSKIKLVFTHVLIAILLNAISGILLRHFISEGFLFDILKLIRKLLLSIYVITVSYRFDLFKLHFIKNNLIVIATLSLFLLFFSIRFVTNFAIETNQEISSVKHLIFILTAFSVGLFEEFLFRLVVFLGIYKLYFFNNPNKLLKSILVSSIIFSLVHFFNVFNHNYERLSILIQVFAAFSLGLLFQCLFVRFQNIILVIILHGIFNYLGMYKSVLLTNSTDAAVPYKMEDFISSLVSVLIISMIIIFPICYFLIVSGKRKHRIKWELMGWLIPEHFDAADESIRLKWRNEISILIN